MVESSAAWTSGLWMPEERALVERAAQTTPAHTIRGMFMVSTIETLRRAQGEDAVNRALAATGFHAGEWSQMRKVPLNDFNKLRTEVGRALAPSLGGMEQSIARIAAASVEIFFESVAGRTMMLLAGKDPHRLLGAAPNGYGLAVDDGAKRSYTKVGEKEGRFTFQGDRLGPCHQLGVFSAAISTVCNVDINVTIRQEALLDFDFDVTWP